MLISIILATLISNSGPANKEVVTPQIEQACVSFVAQDFSTPQKIINSVACSSFIAGYVDGLEMMNAINKSHTICVNKTNKDTMLVAKTFVEMMKDQPTFRLLPAKVVLYGVVGILYRCDKEL